MAMNNREQDRKNRRSGTGDMSVRQAGKLGGEKVRRLVKEGEQEQQDQNL